MTRVRVHLDGRVYDARIKAEDGAQHIEVDGESFRIDSAQPTTSGNRAVAVRIDGHEHTIERLDLEHVRINGAESTFLIDHVERAGSEAAVGAAGLTVRPPMPGRIVRLDVGIGDTVHAGDVIAVLEAMKMQNEVTSPGTGTVRRLLVKEGDTVDAQHALLELGPPEDEAAPTEAAKEVTA